MILDARCTQPSCKGRVARSALGGDLDWKLCSTCAGTGQVAEHKCAMCKGWGWLLVRDGTMSAKIGRNL